MFKNVATKIELFAFTPADGLAKTGDAANLTAYVSKDQGAVTVLADTSATEMDATNAPGWYIFDVAQAETNADALLFTGKSATAGVKIVGRPIHTTPNKFSTLVIDAAGLADANMVKAGPSGSGAAQTAGDIPARLPAALTANGNMKSSVLEFIATTLTETSGQIAAAFKKFFDIASPTSTMNRVTLVDTVTTTASVTDVAGIGGSAPAATNLRRAVLGTVLGTVGSGSTTTSIVTSSLDPAAAVTDQYKGRSIVFDRGTTTANLRGQGTPITGSSSGGILTVTALTDAPVSGDTFTIT